VDLATLERLATDGLRAVPDDRLVQCADWCWDWGIASGDARYCVLWCVLSVIDGWWGDGVPTEAFERVDAVLRRGVRHVLEAPTASSGAQFAHDLAQELEPLLV
jgi:hypothetical protein